MDIVLLYNRFVLVKCGEGAISNLWISLLIAKLLKLAQFFDIYPIERPARVLHSLQVFLKLVFRGHTMQLLALV